MTKFIGRLVNVGIGKESVRGTAVAPTLWIPKMELSHNDKIKQVVDGSSIGVIEDAGEASITQKYSEGTLKGRALDDSLGLWLLASIGTDTPVLVGGETIVYDHTFAVLESAQHPSLTVSVKDPNAGNGLRYTLAMVDSFDFSAELGKYIEIAIKYRANSNATGTALTPTYPTTSNYFLPQHGVCKIATNQAGLGASPALTLKKVQFQISKNIEDDQVLGSITATDRINKQFTVDGSFEITYDDRSYIDTIMLSDLQKALRISFVNTDKVIGVSSSPSITFDFNKVKLTDIAVAQGNDAYVTQVIKFKALYNTTDAKMMTAVLRNLTASY